MTTPANTMPTTRRRAAVELRIARSFARPVRQSKKR
jgi:hypothetical protein